MLGKNIPCNAADLNEKRFSLFLYYKIRGQAGFLAFFLCFWRLWAGLGWFWEPIFVMEF